MSLKCFITEALESGWVDACELVVPDIFGEVPAADCHALFGLAAKPTPFETSGGDPK